MKPSRHSKTRAAQVLGSLLLTVALVLGLFQVALAADTRQVSPTGVDAGDCIAAPCLTLQYAYDQAAPGDTIRLLAGTHTLAANVSISKADLIITGEGAASTIVQVSGAGERLTILAAGVTLKDLHIQKTDKTGLQNIVWIHADNVTIQDNTFSGQFVIGDPEVSRAMVVSTHTGLNITGNTIYALRQPAYISGSNIGLNGTIANNHVYGTKGWVLESASLDFQNNTWGTGAQANVYDIAILSGTSPAFYPDITVVSDLNNEAVIEDQRVSPAVLSVVHVDDDALTAGTGSPTEPYPTITPAVARVVAGGKIKVAAGTYVENLVLNKSLELAGAGMDDVILLPALSFPGPGCGGSMCAGSSHSIIVQAQDVVIHDLTVDGDNPALTSGVVRGGADLDARNGIITLTTGGPYHGLEVYNTTVKNIYLRGIYPSSGGSFNIHDNVVENVQGETASIAIFNWVGAGMIENNRISHVNDAIASNHGAGLHIVGNTITDASTGIHVDNSGDGGVGAEDLIEGNVITDCKPDGYGIFTFVNYIPATVDHNVVLNCTVGLSIWGSGFTAQPLVLFTNNTVIGPGQAAGSVGAYVTTDTTNWGYTPVNAEFSGNLIAGFETGVYFTANAQTWNPTYTPQTLTANFHDNVILNNVTGADFQDPSLQSPSPTLNMLMENNFWGAASGPLSTGGTNEAPPCNGDASLDMNADGEGNPVANKIDYCPWVAEPPDNMLQTLVENSCGGVVQLGPATYTGGVTISCPVTVRGVEGTVVTNGSPAFIIESDNVTIEDLAIDMGGDASNAIETGADVNNLVIKNLEISNGGGDGINIGHDVDNLQIVDNYIHGLGGDAVEYGSETTVGGVHEVQGNLFQDNTGLGVNNLSTSTYEVTYNSWGAQGGPAAAGGDGASSGLVFAPWTHAGLSLASSGSPVADRVAEGSTIVYTINLDAAEVFGADFTLDFDETRLQVTAITDPFSFELHYGDCAVSSVADANANGEISFCGIRETSALTGLDQPVLQVTFEAISSGVAPLVFDPATDSFSMSPPFGASNNIYADELLDGSVTVYDVFPVSGRIDLQGRANDSGAQMTFAPGLNQGYGPFTFSVSDYWGAVNAGGVVEDTYNIGVVMDRYLDVLIPDSGRSFSATELDALLSTLTLWGGDAITDESIGLSDATAIGGEYGHTGGGIGNVNTDINNDGRVDLLDLVLMGGNYGKISATAYGLWVP